MNVSIYIKGYYEEFYGFGLRENKANSKPKSNGLRAFLLMTQEIAAALQAS